MTLPPLPHDHPAHPAAAAQALDRAAAHLAAAAELLETGDASDQVFSPARGLAAQLQLIGHGISPGIAPATDAFAPADTATGHIDYALTLLETLDPVTRSGDAFVWHARLTELRSRLTSLTGPGS
jgi:hypothetical protein